MGECFISRRGGGGGSGLNVVTGLGEPSSAKENTIWVKSDAAGKKYVFSETEPGSPTEGLIWFRVSSMGIITRADVYTAGAWAAVDTYMYLGGTWTQIASAWNGDLFYDGNQYEDVTGGWTGTSALTSTSPNLVSKANTVYNQKAIDLSTWTTLHVLGNIYSTKTGGFENSYIRVRSGGVSGIVAVSKGFSNGYNKVVEYTLDIASLSGEYTITVTSTTAGGVGGKIDITRIWLT